MKKFILAAGILSSLNLFAGAYSLKCSNSEGTVKIDKGTLQLNGKNFEYFSEYASTKLMSLNLIEFLKETNPKVVVGLPNTPTAVAQGGIKIISEKFFKDACGNEGSETRYKENIGLYDVSGTAIVDLIHINCVERMIIGHCTK